LLTIQKYTFIGTLPAHVGLASLRFGGAARALRPWLHPERRNRRILPGQAVGAGANAFFHFTRRPVRCLFFLYG
jgi:hypothetical protein